MVVKAQMEPPSIDRMLEFGRWGYDMAMDQMVDIIEEMDPRVDDWPMMSNPIYPASVVLFYLIFVICLLPRLMGNRPPIPVRLSLIAYNVMAVIFNFCMGAALTVLTYEANYSLQCQRVRFRSENKLEDEIAVWLWLFHLSKIMELGDTIFIIVRQKGSHLTFLHVYHHSTIVFASWLGVRFVPGGSTAIIAAINCWVHVIMYMYFKLTTLGYLRFSGATSYKKFVTTMQITQFVFTMFICLSSLYLGEKCGFPAWISTWLLFYMFTFITLFTNFYVNAYF